jgi:nitroreductase/NAD-dependent dihydropyrimidine dehydrogenase PreA subunit
MQVTQDNLNNSLHIVIDASRCIRCGICVKECPSKVIKLTESSAIEAIPFACIDCGHCVAVCPKDAIQHRKIDPTSFSPKQDPQISFDQLNILMRNRRSIRNFKNEAIPQELLQKILDSVKYAPTGENAQELEYLIITQDAILQQIRTAMATKFQLGKKLLNAFLLKSIIKAKLGAQEFLRTKTSLDQILEEYSEGKDPFLRGAPALIIIYTKHKPAMANLDAGIAGYHINLICETLGLGSCWIGFHSILCQMFKSFRNISQVPTNHKVLASIVVGFPSIKYLKVIGRFPQKTQIL